MLLTAVIISITAALFGACSVVAVMEIEEEHYLKEEVAKGHYDYNLH